MIKVRVRVLGMVSDFATDKDLCPPVIIDVDLSPDLWNMDVTSAIFINSAVNGVNKMVAKIEVMRVA